MDIVEYINNINKDNANKFIASTSSNITVKRDIDACVSDTSWIDMVEECIPYLDNIIRNQRRFIVQEENIVPIEKAKVVTEESIRHLAQHTSMIVQTTSVSCSTLKRTGTCTRVSQIRPLPVLRKRSPTLKRTPRYGLFRKKTASLK